MGDSTHRDVAVSFDAILEDELGVEVDLIQWLNGPRGRIDGVAAGWVSSDQLHLSLQGAWRLAELLADLGFEPASS